MVIMRLTRGGWQDAAGTVAARDFCMWQDLLHEVWNIFLPSPPRPHLNIISQMVLEGGTDATIFFAHVYGGFGSVGLAM